jgi:hypothetical protein
MLHLSGRVISATFIIPYNLGFAPDHEWVRYQNLHACSFVNHLRTCNRDVETLPSSIPSPILPLLTPNGVTHYSAGRVKSVTLLPHLQDRLYPSILHNAP